MNSELEQKLVNQAKNGDRAALTELWNQLSPKILGYLVNTTRNRSLADDLLQSTWLHAIEALPRFQYRSNTKFSAWLFAIARNECRQHWRKEQKENAYTETQSSTELHVQPNTDTLLVEQMLSKLTDDEQELIRLRYIADLPLNDIARILNISFVGVRVRLHRALKKIKHHE